MTKQTFPRRLHPPLLLYTSVDNSLHRTRQPATTRRPSKRRVEDAGPHASTSLTATQHHGHGSSHRQRPRLLCRQQVPARTQAVHACTRTPPLPLVESAEPPTQAMNLCPCNRGMRRTRCTCKDYEAVAARDGSILDEAMFTCHCDVGNVFDKCDDAWHIMALDYRAATFEAMQELQRAERDAKWMLELAPRLPDVRGPVSHTSSSHLAHPSSRDTSGWARMLAFAGMPGLPGRSTAPVSMPTGTSPCPPRRSSRYAPLPAIARRGVDARLASNCTRRCSRCNVASDAKIPCCSRSRSSTP